MAPDPNQIDISLSLLPGESKVVIDKLIEQLQKYYYRDGGAFYRGSERGLSAGGRYATLVANRFE